MKIFFLLVFSIIFSKLCFSQSTLLQEGNECFAKGDYACAIEKYKLASNVKDQLQKKFAIDNLKQADACYKLLLMAQNSYEKKDFIKAKEFLLALQIENPNDEYAKEKLKEIQVEVIKLSVSKNVLSFSNVGGTEIIDVTTDADSFSVHFLPAWCFTKKFKNQLYVSVLENPSLDERIGNFSVSAGNKIININIRQQKINRKYDAEKSTLLPQSIKGSLKFCGIPDKPQFYEIVGGILGTGAKKWYLYRNNQIVDSFTRNAFQLTPTVSSTYIISPDNNPELKYIFTLEIVTIPQINVSIAAPTLVCSGQEFSLELKNAQFDPNMKWNWYRKSESPHKEPKYLGSLQTIKDFIDQSTEYYVNLEYKNCPLPNPIRHFVASYSKPFIPTTSYSYTSDTKEKANIGVSIPNMELIKWEWSLDNFNTIFSDSSVLTSFKLRKGNNNFYVRYMDRCGKLSPVASFSIIREKNDYFFLNAGLNIFNPKSFKSFNISFGNRYWYFRGKASLASLSSAVYSTEFFGNKLEITNQSRILNYPVNSGSYYVVNGNQAVSRKSFTTGILIGSPRLKLFAGVGFGQSSTLWGLNVHEYSSGNIIRELWATNKELSAAGLEIETGVFIKCGKFNLMPGISLIHDSKLNSPYLEVNIGLGFSNK